MLPESAEMTKHAINSFLALSISYINEIASISEAVGADAYEVAQGLKSEPRIGKKAYLSPGTAFAGGTLARDVASLTKIGENLNKNNLLISVIKQSNDKHKLWEFDKILEKLKHKKNPQITILGIGYKEGSDTIRRSRALELTKLLLKNGYEVKAFDPLIKKLPQEFNKIKIFNHIDDSIKNTNATVVCTGWQELKEKNWEILVKSMKNPIIIDGNACLSNCIKNIKNINYYVVGKES